MTSRNRSESEKGIYLSGNCCVICGWDKRDYKKRLLLEGAHVRGMRNTPDYDKFNNIVAMCPNHHTEFDAGNLTIDPQKKRCIHINLKDRSYGKKLVGKIDHIKLGYFDYHKANIYRGKC